jgi:spore coat polysaccharide biosynthesis protein SpsF
MDAVAVKIVATIEARMTSTRLPGKVILPVLGRPLLDHLFRRLERVPSLDAVVLATTTNASDDVLEELARSHRIACFRGSEDDVTGRVIGAADSVGADVVAAITADCPIIDHNLVEQIIRTFVHNKADYASSCLPDLGYPDGMDTYVFALSTLKRSYAMTSEPLDREHVTRYFQLHPEVFTSIGVAAPPDMYWPGLGLTLDEPKDYTLITSIIEHFGDAKPDFSCREIIAVLKHDHPEWLELNKDVKRKGLH